MRPTEIGVKSPCYRTPAAGYPTVNKHGSSTTFSKSDAGLTIKGKDRFKQYQIDAKKSGYRVGPGSYNYAGMGSTSQCQSPQFRPYSCPKGLAPEGYYYTGNLLVYDDSFVPKNKRSASGKSPGGPFSAKRVLDFSRLHSTACSMRALRVLDSPAKRS